MSVVTNLSPILFLSFKDLYSISYSLLGLLVLVNFSTQLAVDLFFSFFSYKINMQTAVRLTPALTVVGLVVFALAPVIFPGAVYAGLLLGTLIFSSGAGLCEVLISPVIAAIPAENPEHEMSKLHSIYAWGVVFVVPISSLFIMLAGGEAWQILALGFAVVPLIATILFWGAELPRLEGPERSSGVIGHLKNPMLWVCFFAIFLGGASEFTMAQWSSSYIEGSLGIPKIFGDIFGVALFALMLGLGRTLYSKFGKNAERVLLFGAIGALICYLTAALSPSPIIGLISCALTGLSVSMLWPGSLIVGSDRIPTGGVFIYAMMAAGGDLGASVGPQLTGVITDVVSLNSGLAASLGIPAEELGMRAGMLLGALFPLAAIVVYLILVRTKKSGCSTAPDK